MEPFLDLFSVVSFVAVVQGVLLSAYMLLSLRKQGKGSLFLALLLLTLSYTLGHHALAYSGYMFYWPQLYGTGSLFALMVGPLIYLYFRSISEPAKPLSLWHSLHFLPFVVYQCFRLPYYGFPTEQKKILLSKSLANMYGETNGFDLQGFVLEDIHPLLYLGLTAWYVFNNKNSKAHKLNHGVALRYLMMFGSAWLFLSLVYPLYSLKFGKDELFWLLPSILMVIPIIFMAYSSLRTPQHLIGSGRYQTSNLSSEQAFSFVGKLKKMIEEGQLFLDPKLSLHAVALKAGVNTKYISQSINDQLGVGFSDFINTYRVSHARQLLEDPEQDKYTIHAIAEMSGFHSKDAFYRAFKKHFKKTPAEFKKELRDQILS